MSLSGGSSVESLLELLGSIRARPGLFLGQESITALAAFIDGFLYALERDGGESGSFLSEFQAWVSRKYRISTVHRWSEILRFYEVEEPKAFRRFFVLLEEFRNEAD